MKGEFPVKNLLLFGKLCQCSVVSQKFQNVLLRFKTPSKKEKTTRFGSIHKQKGTIFNNAGHSKEEV
jgi:hypothetical protein